MTSPFPLTAGAVAAACGGRLVGGPADARLPAFSTDSRTLAAGDAFIALVGPRFDGNVYTGDAVARGAAAVMVSDAAAAEIGRRAGIATIVVLDTVGALHALASHIRRLSAARIVAITGSVGKTTTKEATASFVSARFRTMRNRGNLNNHIGLPLSLLELQAGAEVAVVELGMNHPGEIATLVSIARPDILVWTNVGSAHLEFFGSMDAVAEAKAEILQGASSDTVFVANADDARVMKYVPSFPGRVVTFGVERDADVQAGTVRDRGVEGQTANVRTPAGAVMLHLMLPGPGHLSNVLAAIAVALHLGVPIGEIAARAITLAPTTHRGEVIRLARGIRVLDDCYNSSPTALAASLTVVASTAVDGRRIGVLGEMLELGTQAGPLHRECGSAAVDAGISRLLTVGGDAARELGEGARDAGLEASSIVHVADAEAAADLVGQMVGDGDLVIVKGSRGIRLERVVDRLKVEFA